MLLTHVAREFSKVKVTLEGLQGRLPRESEAFPGAVPREAADMTHGLHLRRCGSHGQMLVSRHIRGPHLGT